MFRTPHSCRRPHSRPVFNRQYSTRVLHITDVEGSNVFFKSIKNNSIVRYHPDKGLYFNKSVARPYFIYGGDVTDRGNHDLEITDLLVDFKMREPHRVSLLAGNREIKNNRIKIELDPVTIRKRLLDSKSPRWLPEKEHTVPLDYVIAEMAAGGLQVKRHDMQTIEKYIYSLSIEQCQLIYLRWMLEKTMGSPNTFRYRREEIGKYQFKKQISDIEVLNNFLRETAPQGSMGKYLQVAEVGVAVRDTGILAVHGGVTEFNYGRLPDMPENARPIADARLWISQFNQWYADQIKHWIHFTPDDVTVPACTRLDESALPLPGKNKTVITSDMLAKDRSFMNIPSQVSEYLKQNGIQLVLTGHQPSGDHPAILRDDKNNIMFINGDTGYAKYQPENPDDTRGSTWHTLEITAAPDRTDIHINAALSDGTPVTSDFTILPGKIHGDAYMGKILPDGRLVQCKLTDSLYRLIQQSARQVKYSTMNDQELAALLDKKVFLTNK